ncbi:MAG TPA: bifunctional metallophosphatase/5'-nucleotidase [Novosphingobium sp.]|nr:bifunctional metallophosphatase/5'-nucleotidase [Novosphingobium sp.]
MIAFKRLLAALIALPLAACATVPQDSGTVTVGLAAFNDFHGSLEPPKLALSLPDGAGGTVAVPAGGAAWMASALDDVRARYQHHLTVSAGDMIGASQLASSLYLDEPTIAAMNRMGLDYAAVGNHEFDRGAAELQRMQAGGCAKYTPREPCLLEPFAGARFRFLAASTRLPDGSTLFPATAIHRFGKGRRAVRVGLIGLTLAGTPLLVSPEGIAGLTFADEAETINALVPKLKRAGADAVVVLIHEGGRQAAGQADPNACEGLSGAITGIVERLVPGVDAVVSGHTHAAYVCAREGAPLLTSAGLYGAMVTEIALEIDPRASRVVSRRAVNRVVQSEGFTGPRGAVAPSDAAPRLPPRADIAALVSRYAQGAEAQARRPVGRLSGPATRDEALRMLGGTIGNLIADGQLAATRAAGAEIALMNPFGIRAPLVPAADGTVTFGDLYRVQPFGNQVVTLSMTGAELKAALEQGFDDLGPDQALSPSAGLTYGFDPSRPVGDRIVDLAFNGAPLDPARVLRVTVNGFLALGGDGFSVFAGMPDRVTGPTDIEAFEAWFRHAPLREVPQEERVLPYSTTRK